MEGANKMSTWIVYDPATAKIHGKFFTLKKVKENFYVRHERTITHNTILPRYVFACAKVDMEYYDEWYMMVLLKCKNYTG